MKIKTKISFKEYQKLLFYLAYKRTILRVILGVALALIIWILGYNFHFLPVPKPQIYQYITLVLILVAQPMVIYLTIRRSYKSSNNLREKLEIEFMHSQIKINGESFYTEIEWKNIFKIDEEANWILFYVNSLSAIIVPKKAFHGTQLEELKKIILTIPKVPVNLKP